jgi:hypothetical protein
MIGLRGRHGGSFIPNFRIIIHTICNMPSLEVFLIAIAEIIAQLLCFLEGSDERVSHLLTFSMYMV